ncbi:uncharacterized protein L199_000145 [Kwoniella botswanensis]|uniref:uncharacterized protein n=1 Tax=Kwoniella botswanensis TaxID=1268659 RepID=UPI00315CF4DB
MSMSHSHPFTSYSNNDNPLSSPENHSNMIRTSLSLHSPSMTSIQPPATPIPTSASTSTPLHPQYSYPAMQHNQSYPPPSSVQPYGPQRNNSYPQWQVHTDHHQHAHYPHTQPHQHYHHDLPSEPSRRTIDQSQIASMQDHIYSPHAIRASTHESLDESAQGVSRSTNRHEISPEQDTTSGSIKKRPRQISIPANAQVQSSSNESQSETSTPMTTMFWNVNTKSPTSASSSTKVQAELTPTTNSNQPHHPTTISISVPSVLTREKKQKACTKCRKAKLKCILEQGSQECVRCKVRKEKCIFFPKSQEDETQQKLIRDVYEATDHLSQLSKAVHHILHHLTEKNIIPPFVSAELPEGLDHYDPPERPILYQPQQAGEPSAGKSEESRNTGGRGKRRKVNNKVVENQLDELEEEEGSGTRPSTATAVTTGEITPTESSASSSIPSVLQGSSLTRSQNNSHHSGTGDSHSSTVITRLPSTTVSSPRPVSTSTRLPPPLIPPNRPMSHTPPLRTSPVDTAHFIHPSIGQVLSSSGEGWIIGQPPHDIEMRSISPRTRMSSPPILTSSYVHSPYTQADLHSAENPDRPTHNGRLSSYEEHTMAPDSQMDVVRAKDTELMVIGSQDPRKDVVKKGLVSAKDALFLVNYFHQSVSPLLYGYPLQFHHFPYIAGPQYITPLLLSVLCLISSERVSSYHKKYHRVLAEEVTTLLQTSPAESWQRFEGGYTPDFGDPDGDEPLDAEFGLGPEEIVAACILATYMTEREQASVIARSAFRWARGWIKLLKSSTSPRFTIAASVGLVPPERHATDLDMARIWLLCYIVDSTERLQLSLDAPPPRDALSFCYMLIPPTNPMAHGEARHSAQDVLLTFHARLISSLNKWRHKFKSLISASQPPVELVEQLKNLAAKVNVELVWWESEFENALGRSVTFSTANITKNGNVSPTMDNTGMAFGLRFGQSSKQHIMITFHFVRMSVNSTLSKYLPSSTSYTTISYPPSNEFEDRQLKDYQLNINSKKIVVESAIRFLEICKNWHGYNPGIEEEKDREQSLFNLSPTYLFFLTLMGSELMGIVRESKEGVSHTDTTDIKADDVISLLKSVGEMLFLGELDEQHVSRTTAKTLFLYCQKLQKYR